MDPTFCICLFNFRLVPKEFQYACDIIKEHLETTLLYLNFKIVFSNIIFKSSKSQN